MPRPPQLCHKVQLEFNAGGFGKFQLRVYVATELRFCDANPFRVEPSVNGLALPGLLKVNPGLGLANAFSVSLKLHQYIRKDSVGESVTLR